MILRLNLNNSVFFVLFKLSEINILIYGKGDEGSLCCVIGTLD